MHETAQQRKTRLVFGCLEQIQQAKPARKRGRARSDGVAHTAQPTLWAPATLQGEPPDESPSQTGKKRFAGLSWSKLLSDKGACGSKPQISIPC
jgi:hypothetical protein